MELEHNQQSDYILVRDFSHIYVQVESNSMGNMQELSDFFTFKVPGYQFMPSYRSGNFDGSIRLLNRTTGLIYKGLLPYIKTFCNQRKYRFLYENSCNEKPDTTENIVQFLKNLNVHSDKKKITFHLHQFKAILNAVQKERSLLLSPTGSGKSLIIYSLIRYYLEELGDDTARILLIVPKVSLVEQMYTDFEDYSTENGWNVEENCHKVFQGQDKNTKKPVMISTWQSIHTLPKSYFSQFNVVMVDETHKASASSIKSILEKLVNCRYRFGLTGTLKETQCHHLVIEGLLGSVYTASTTSDLIEKELLAKINIQCYILNYPLDFSKSVCKMKYFDEIEFLISDENRNRFIQNLALAQTKNTLILYRYVEKHGKILKEMITKNAGKNRKVFYIHGGVDADVREKIRTVVEKEKDAIIIASLGTYAIGINIKNLHNIIFATPSKSRIEVLQSIGRSLRNSKDKSNACIFDISDNLTYKKKQNYTIKHFMKRVEYYNAEKFPYTIKQVDLYQKP